MDLRLSEALGTQPGFWLALQTQRDLWVASQSAKARPRIKRIRTPHPAWLAARADKALRLKPGERVGLRCESSRLFWFDGDQGLRLR